MHGCVGNQNCLFFRYRTTIFLAQSGKLVLKHNTPTTSSTTTSSTSSTPVPQTVLSTWQSLRTLRPRSTTSQTKIVISTGTIASATPSTASSPGSVNTAVVVGGIAGCLAGLAVLGFLIMRCIRRKCKPDEDGRSASVFKRQSAIL
ncbi:hypothetical protein EV424DRAFT_1612724 [Suillus variegatus]|nr:hypothetical protein EV424DRAFT_1612724 [Suillus variegatus]